MAAPERRPAAVEPTSAPCTAGPRKAVAAVARGQGTRVARAPLPERGRPRVTSPVPAPAMSLRPRPAAAPRACATLQPGSERPPPLPLSRPSLVRASGGNSGPREGSTRHCRNVREAAGAASRSCGPPRAAHASPPAPGSAGLSLGRRWLSEPPAPCPSLQPLLPLGAPVPPPGGGGLPPGGWRSWAAGAPGPAVPGSSG